MHEEIQKKERKKKAGTNNLNRHIAPIHRLISLSVCLPTSHSAKFFIPHPPTPTRSADGTDPLFSRQTLLPNLFGSVASSMLFRR